MKKRFLLRYSPARAAEPILSWVIKETGVLLNILYAEFRTQGGEILIATDAQPEEIQRVVDLFRQKGVEILEIKEAIRLDRESCVDCGACLSLCPTRALYMDDEKSVCLDEEKCIYCKLCVPACPVRALAAPKFE
ncbi:MAG: 4Fe-4S binding protein [Candidatus Hadarchaeales archaeon]